jgi:hypothetical protein
MFKLKVYKDFPDDEEYDEVSIESAIKILSVLKQEALLALDRYRTSLFELRNIGDRRQIDERIRKAKAADEETFTIDGDVFKFYGEINNSCYCHPDYEKIEVYLDPIWITDSQQAQENLKQYFILEAEKINKKKLEIEVKQKAEKLKRDNEEFERLKKKLGYTELSVR